MLYFTNAATIIQLLEVLLLRVTETLKYVARAIILLWSSELKEMGKGYGKMEGRK
jgi:hypothetical protein